MKNKVLYDSSKRVAVKKGSSAIVSPVDHPSDLVSNTKEVRTSAVIAYDRSTGVFETENTIYTPKRI